MDIFAILRPISWLALPSIFLLSLLLPVTGDAGKKRHLYSILLACTFTLLMVAYMFLALLEVAEKVQPDEYMVAAGTYIFEGTYVDGAPRTWLLSFARPEAKTKFEEEDDVVEQCQKQNEVAQPAGHVEDTGSLPAEQGPVSTIPNDETSLATQSDEPDIATGFGAPLWVLLFAVLGAGLLTVTIVINEIAARDRWDDPAYLRSADQMIVRHQMFVLFSPLGAMFTYQALVATGAAGQSITVAVAVLGAGATLPYLLDYATQKSVSVLKGATQAEE